MKRAISFLVALILLLAFPLTAYGEPVLPNDGVDIAAIYAQQEKQPFTRAGGNILFLDTIWIFLTDGTFVQYAFLEDDPIVFSLGTYRFEDGGSFLPVDKDADGGSLIITRSAKYAAGTGLANYSSEHSYSLKNLGFTELYYAGEEGKTVEAIFAGCNKQTFGEDRMLDTYWIFYSDMSFEQYACLGSTLLLFSEGSYSLSDGANFDFEPDATDCGSITITRTMKFQEGLNYAPYSSEHTYDFNSLGFAKLTPIRHLPDIAEGEASPAAAGETAYDSSAYEAAVQAVRDEYVQVKENGLSFNEDGKVDYDTAAHPELPEYTARAAVFPGTSLYEAFHDFDGNGVPELLIATGSDGNSLIGLYAFDGADMRYLCKDHPLGQRTHLTLNDGLFVVHGSSGALTGELAFYRIADDGWSTELIDVVDYEYSDAEHVTYTSELGNLSAEEIEQRGLADWPEFDFQPVWTCFYPG